MCTVILDMISMSLYVLADKMKLERLDAFILENGQITQRWWAVKIAYCSSPTYLLILFFSFLKASSLV